MPIRKLPRSTAHRPGIALLRVQCEQMLHCLLFLNEQLFIGYTVASYPPDPMKHSPLSEQNIQKSLGQIFLSTFSQNKFVFIHQNF